MNPLGPPLRSFGGQKLSLRSALPPLLVLLGIGLRLERFLSGRSLWSDEAKLALNVLQRSVSDLLFIPLDDRQVAPPGFLLVEKLAVTLLGDGEWVLRLFPLFCGLFSVVLFWRLLRELEMSETAVVLGLLLFAIAPYLVHFSSDTKPYAADVAMSVLLILFTARFFNRADARAGLHLGLIGGTALWFSQAVGFVVLGAAVGLTVLALERRARPRHLGVIGGLWIAGALPALWLSMRVGGPHYAFMLRYWANGFLPFPPTSSADLLDYARGLEGLFIHPMALARMPEIGIAAFLTGLALMAKTHRPLLALLVSPVLGLFLASGLRMYPLGGDGSPVAGRIVLFLLPILIIGSVWGAQILLRTSRRPWTLVALGLSVVLVVDTSLQLPLYHRMYRMDSRGAASLIAENRQPGDALYAVDLIWSALSYYSRHRPLGDVIRLDGTVPDSVPSNRTWVVHYSFENALAIRLLSTMDRPFRTFHMNGVYVHLVLPRSELQTSPGKLPVEGERMRVVTSRTGGRAQVYTRTARSKNAAHEAVASARARPILAAPPGRVPSARARVAPVNPESGR